ncbi:hypothetical protein SynSYN20_03411 [Synechococcus sp. SYN20]|nr:hypothetical protein SynSYN20_03411 [Synechococcus sp. SYN20]
MNQVAGKGPIAMIDEGCEIWKTFLGLRESLSLPADDCHVFRANRCGLGIAITAAGREAEAEAHAEAKRSDATQGAQHGERERRENASLPALFRSLSTDCQERMNL